jgi:hypothetical protein
MNENRTPKGVPMVRFKLHRNSEHNPHFRIRYGFRRIEHLRFLFIGPAIVSWGWRR